MAKTADFEMAIDRAPGWSVSAIVGGQFRRSSSVLRGLAVALSVSADLLIFDKEERGPDDTLRLQIEAAARLNPEEKKALMLIFEGILLQHQHAEAALRLTRVS
ncbi:hypothetical protein EPN29_05325 [bacterium]|nr:MAG: hypothetical protein EPN29_05325 [bacterium]